MTVSANYEAWPKSDLIAEVQRLHSELAFLDVARSGNAVEVVRTKLGVSRTEAKVLVALSDGNYKSREEIHRIIYCDRKGSLPQMKVIDVVISNLRKRLSGGLAIETAGRGYLLRGSKLISEILGVIVPPACMVQTDPKPGDGARKDHGKEPREVLKQIRSLVNSNMVAKFTSRQMANLAKLRHPVAGTLDRLEHRGFIFIRERPGRGRIGSEWAVYLRAKAQ